MKQFEIQEAARFVANHDYLRQQLPYIRGKWHFVVPGLGSDLSGRTGRTPELSLATMTNAYTKTISGNGDGICIISYGITTADTTTYLTEPLDWTKWGITVFGICAPTRFAQRARISNASASTDLAYLIDVQGSNNSFCNTSIHNFGSNALAVGGMKMSGDRNFLGNVSLIGGGGRTGLVGDYDLSLSGGENTFVDDMFGSDTSDGGNVVSGNILFPSGGQAARNRFYNCETNKYRTAGTTAGAIKSGGGDSIVRDQIFDNCHFGVYRDGAVAAEVGVVVGTAPNNGFFIFRGNCSRKGYVDWKDVDSAFAARVIVCGPASSEVGGAAELANPS